MPTSITVDVNNLNARSTEPCECCLKGGPPTECTCDDGQCCYSKTATMAIQYIGRLVGWRNKIWSSDDPGGEPSFAPGSVGLPTEPIFDWAKLPPNCGEGKMTFSAISSGGGNVPAGDPIEIYYDSETDPHATIGVNLGGSAPLGKGSVGKCPFFYGGNMRYAYDPNTDTHSPSEGMGGYASMVNNNGDTETIDFTSGSLDPDMFASVSLGFNTAKCPGAWQVQTSFGVTSNTGSETEPSMTGGCSTCIGGDCLGPEIDGPLCGHDEAECYGPDNIIWGFGSYKIYETLSATLTNNCCRDANGKCVPGITDGDGNCLVTPLAGAFASIDGDAVVVPTWQLQRSAEICLPADDVAAFVAECVLAGDEEGDNITISRDRWNAVAKKWRPRMKRQRPTTTATNQYPHGLGTYTRKGIALASLGIAPLLADAIAKFMGKTGCGGCAARERRLNELVPDVSQVEGLMGWVKLTPKILAALGTT